VVGGMISATILAIFFVPLFFVVVLKLFKVQPRPSPAHPSSAAAKEV
jgi:multidrug efflux pump